MEGGSREAGGTRNMPLRAPTSYKAVVDKNMPVLPRATHARTVNLTTSLIARTDELIKHETNDRGRHNRRQRQYEDRIVIARRKKATR